VVPPPQGGGKYDPKMGPIFDPIFEETKTLQGVGRKNPAQNGAYFRPYFRVYGPLRGPEETSINQGSFSGTLRVPLKEP